jgi:O-antigen/teichoic acid export membrane protein
MIPSRIKYFINKGENRTALVKKNIIATFIVKGLSVIISLLYVPITLNYLNPTRYGIWMTITSIVAWMTIFDVGLGNGLRNKLSEALTLDDTEKARKYVSTAYFMLSIIVIGILFLFFIFGIWINWSLVLNASISYRQELKELVFIVVTLFGLKFVLNTVSIIATADQNPAYGSVVELIGSALGLLFIWILTLLNKSSLITFGWATMLTPVVVYLFATVIFFTNKYSFLKPSFRSIELAYAKDLTGLGLQFFIIQIAVLIIFQTSNLLISHFFSPAEVTPYNIVFKYYSVLTMVWGIIMTPLWSAFTQAKAQNDIKWMRNTISKLNQIMIITVIVLVIMSFVAQYVIFIWTSGKVSVSLSMIWIFALYTLISIWNNIYSFFLNGISEIKVQIYTSIAAALLNIPFSFLFVKYFHMGSEGVVLSMAISLSFFAIAGPIHSYKVLRSWSMN